MAYEIWKESLVTRDGGLEEDVHGHRAVVTAGVGVVEIRMATHRDDTAYLRTRGADMDGDVVVMATDLVSALRDLRLLGPFGGLSSGDQGRQERAATIIEQVCQRLTQENDPVAEVLAVDLRTIFLDLFERAAAQ